VESTGVSKDMSKQQVFRRLPLHYIIGHSDKTAFINQKAVKKVKKGKAIPVTGHGGL
jgi:hypothetical protein